MLRIIVGLLFFCHGSQKVFGLFDRNTKRGWVCITISINANTASLTPP